MPSPKCSWDSDADPLKDITEATERIKRDTGLVSDYPGVSAEWQKNYDARGDTAAERESLLNDLREFAKKQEQAKRLVQAVAAGATVYAEPGTAEVMGEFLPVQECDWLEPGVLYAIDFGRYNLPESLFDQSKF